MLRVGASAARCLTPRRSTVIGTAHLSHDAGAAAGHNGMLAELLAVSAVDGRYASKTRQLQHQFSEYGLIRNRVVVEVEWLKAMSACPQMDAVPEFNADTLKVLADIVAGFSPQEAVRVKQIEGVTNHDVKAVEYYLKEKFAMHPSLAAVAEFLHFACTSEDVNNLSYALMLKDGREKVVSPTMAKLVQTIRTMAHQLHDAPMLARTHGQPATPTTMGKEMANYSYRLNRQLEYFDAVPLLGKFNGAVGNFNAHVVAFPEINWPTLAETFVQGLGLTYNPYSTQIEPHDYLAEMFHALSRFNTVLLDFDRNMWSYISLKYFKQRTVATEVGSSTMPHKVNPIDFENSEGNLGIANAVFTHLSEKLPISRFQRDLTDSTVLRSIGLGFAHSIIAYQATLKGLSRVDANRAHMLHDLNENWEVLAEPIQTVMRKVGMDKPYERLKELTRGHHVDHAAIRTFVQGLDLDDAEKQKLLALTPDNYIGLASELARKV